MSKIEELKRDLERHEKNIEQGKSIIASNVVPLEAIRKQIAALEAEGAGPQQWTMYLSWNGQLFPTYGNCPGGRTDKITVIEKKPVVVTKAMAERVSDYICSRLIGSSVDYTMRLLRMAGIDAVAADE